MMATRTDKEKRLKDFIADGLAVRPEGSACAEPIRIVVRNPDSPAAQALLTALLGCDPGVSARVILGEMHSEDPMGASLFDIDCCEFRVLGDPRFGAAHEQLIAGPHVWTGDCLRRDPNKRDAFETYHPADATIHLFAAASFEKLWASAKPVKRVRSAPVAPEIIAAGQPDDSDTSPHDHHH
jgi:hypothetical protein